MLTVMMVGITAIFIGAVVAGLMTGTVSYALMQEKEMKDNWD